MNLHNHQSSIALICGWIGACGDLRPGLPGALRVRVLAGLGRHSVIALIGEDREFVHGGNLFGRREGDSKKMKKVEMLMKRSVLPSDYYSHLITLEF